MKLEHTALPGVLLLTPIRHEDDRGFFSESWSRKTMEQHGISHDFVQDNHSLSDEVGVVRGLHFQAPPYAQVKLVRCGQGLLFDVVVDIRLGSPTYGKWVGYELSAENGRQILIPEGFAHGFVTREPRTEIIYKCSRYYAPQADGGIRWNDPAIGIDWELDGMMPILSDKDKTAPLLKELDSPFVFDDLTA